MMREKVSVVLIAHNEEQVIGDMIAGLLKNYEPEMLELIVVDDCSTDGTAAIVESWAKRNAKVNLIRRTPPPGVGFALRTGFEKADPRAEYILSMDSDFIESILEVRALLEAVAKGDCDGAIGSRFIKGSRLSSYPVGKKIMNRLFHWIVKCLLGIKQNDLTNNFKLYRTCIFKDLPWHSDGYSMNAETGILPILAGYRIREVPVSWVGRNPQMGQSKFRLFRSGWHYVAVIAYALRFKWSGCCSRTAAT